MNKGYIYKTTNLVNNKIYIGKHIGRFDTDYLGSGVIIKKALNKYGKKNFKLEILVFADNEGKIDELEKYYISKYRKVFGKSNLYNVTDGGEGGATRFGKHSKETIEKMKRNRPNQNGEKNPFYGHTHTEEVRKKIKEARAKQVFTKESRERAIATRIKNKEKR